MSKFIPTETPIDDVNDEMNPDEGPNIDDLNQNIVNERLKKWFEAQNVLTQNFSGLVLTWQALKEQNSETITKFEKLERKYIEK